MIGDNHTNPAEEQLENRIIQILMEKGLTRSLAKKMCAEFFYSEIENIAEQPPVPHNFGDFLLENEETNENIRQMLAARWDIGVSEQEIRDWWNKSELERRLIRKCFEMDLKSAFMLLRTNGLSYDEAGKHVRKIMIVYGENDFAINIPYEWKEKVDRLMFDALADDSERVQAEAKLYPSINDYVRERLLCKQNMPISSPKHFN